MDDNISRDEMETATPEGDETMDQDGFYEWMERLSQLTDKLGPAITEQQEINKKVQATLDKQDERLVYAEETLRQVLITQQGIKDILERLNGR